MDPPNSIPYNLKHFNREPINFSRIPLDRRLLIIKKQPAATQRKLLEASEVTKNLVQTMFNEKKVVKRFYGLMDAVQKNWEQQQIYGPPRLQWYRSDVHVVQNILKKASLAAVSRLARTCKNFNGAVSICLTKMGLPEMIESTSSDPEILKSDTFCYKKYSVWFACMDIAGRFPKKLESKASRKLFKIKEAYDKKEKEDELKTKEFNNMLGYTLDPSIIHRSPNW